MKCILKPPEFPHPRLLPPKSNSRDFKKGYCNQFFIKNMTTENCVQLSQEKRCTITNLMHLRCIVPLLKNQCGDIAIGRYPDHPCGRSICELYFIHIRTLLLPFV